MVKLDSIVNFMFLSLNIIVPFLEGMTLYMYNYYYLKNNKRVPWFWDKTATMLMFFVGIL